MRRRALLIVAVLVAALVAADVVLWRWAVGQLTAGFGQWAAAQRAQGLTVAAGPLSASGWPFAADVTVSEVSVAGDLTEFPLRLGWSARQVDLRGSLWHPRSFLISVTGQQHLLLPDRQDIPFSADRTVLTIPLQPGAAPQSAELDVENLRAEGALAGLKLAHLHAHGETTPAAETLSASAEQITLPPLPRTRWPLGPGISSTALDLAITGPPARPSLPLRARAAAWRDGGGSVQVKNATLDWGPLNLTGSATFGLDAQLQPQATATADIRGYVAALDGLAASHVIPDPAAMAAKAVLGLMAHAPARGGPPEVRVPLTLHDGTLSLGHIPLARLPEFSWPDAP